MIQFKAKHRVAEIQELRGLAQAGNYSSYLITPFSVVSVREREKEMEGRKGGKERGKDRELERKRDRQRHRENGVYMVCLN